MTFKPLYTSLLIISVVCDISAIDCSLNVSVNITDGLRIGTKIIKDGLPYGTKDYFETNGTTVGCICNVKICIRKCCALNKLLIGGKCTAAEYAEEFTIDIFDKNEFKRQGNFSYGRSLNCAKRHGLYPDRDPKDQFFIQEDGRIYVHGKNRFEDKDRYCVETLRASENSNAELIAFLCNDEVPSSNEKRIGTY